MIVCRTLNQYNSVVIVSMSDSIKFNINNINNNNDNNNNNNQSLLRKPELLESGLQKRPRRG